MRKLLLISGLFLSTLAADAQVVVPVNNQSFQGAYFATAFDPAELVGTLTSIDVNVTLTATAASTYANDFTIIIGTGLGANDTFPLQVGGYSDIEADERIEWPNGDSAAVGTVCSGNVVLDTPINFDFYPNLKVYFGNGYFGTGSAGTWNGSFTLNGVSLAPLGVKENNAAAFSVYPNPASNVVNIANSNAKISAVTLSDVNGRIVKQVSFDNLSNVQVDVQDLVSGMYLMTIKSAEGETVKKIMKN